MAKRRRASKLSNDSEDRYTRDRDRGDRPALSARGREAASNALNDEAAMLARLEATWASARPHRAGWLSSHPAHKGVAHGTAD